MIKMSNINDPELYENIKSQIHTRLKKQGKGWGMYSSSELSRKYKKAGGTYSGKKPGKQRWYLEKWEDEKGNTCGSTKNKEIKKCRPTIRVNRKTPVTWGEMSESEKRKAVSEKKKTGMGNRTKRIRHERFVGNYGDLIINLSDKEKKKFLSNPSINPVSGRKIKIGGPTYKKLMRKCGFKSPRGSSPIRGKSEEFKRRKEKEILYKPFPAEDGKHKYTVYVKNGKGGKKPIHFGDVTREQYKDKIGYYSSKDHLDKQRLKNFRTRFKNKYDPNNKDSAMWWDWNKLW